MVAMSLQGCQGEMNLEVGHEIPGTEKGAQMLQLVAGTTRADS